jgi:hypothetical protein
MWVVGPHTHWTTPSAGITSMARYTASALQRAVVGVGRVLTSFVIAPPGGRTCTVVLVLVAVSKLDMQAEGTTLKSGSVLLEMER